MKLKAFWSMLIIAVLLASLLSACTKSQEGTEGTKGTEGAISAKPSEAPSNLNPTGYPIVKDKITIKLMGAKAPIQGQWDQLALFTEMEKKTNIHFEFNTPPSSGYEEKKNLSFASNDLPDLFFAGSLTVKDEINYGGQGILIPLEKLIDQYAPNLKKLMEENPNIKKSITTTDGHIYALPGITDEVRGLVPKIWINQEWLKKVGLPMPSTVDDLYTVLKAFKDNDANGNGQPDEIPLSFDKSTLSVLRQGLLADFGFLNSRVDLQDGKTMFVPVQEGYKQYLTFMRKLFAEKLIDQEAFSQTPQQMTANGNLGKIGVFSHAGPFLVVKLEDNTKYAALPPLTSITNKEKIWPKNSIVIRGQFAITKNNKYPGESMRWIDTLYSEEGGIFLFQGPEGLGWKWDNAEHTSWSKIQPPAEYKNTEEFRGAKISPNAGGATPGYIPGNFAAKVNLPQAAHIVKEVADKYQPYLRDVFPIVYFTQEEQNRLNVLETDINTYVDQMEAKFIVGAESLDKWSDYVNTIHKMGVDEQLKIYQSAYDRWKNSK